MRDYTNKPVLFKSYVLGLSLYIFISYIYDLELILQLIYLKVVL